MVDILIIGGGPAGYLAAERAAQSGLSVTLFEEKFLGGTCLNVGCIPSKCFLNSAKMYDHATHSEVFGLSVSDAALDHAKVVARKDQVVKMLVGGVGAKLAKLKVNVVNARAEIQKSRNGTFQVSAAGQSYEGKHLILAMGSSPVVPPIDGLRESMESGFALTNETVFQLEPFPKQLVVVGGGVIGMELAAYFSSAGSDVHVIEMLPSIGGPLDRELARPLKAAYEAKGIKFHLDCQVTSVRNGAVTFKSGTQTGQLAAERVLVSVGRRANTQVVGLERIQVLTERGHIVVDDQMRTNIPNVYAPGDVNGSLMLAHVAYRQAEVAVNNILGRRDEMSYRAVPSIIYTSPEVASVGETEQSARAKGYEVVCARLPMLYSGRYAAENDRSDGFCKLVYDKKKNRLLGTQLMGNGASEIIFSVGALIDLEIPLQRLKKLVFPHPTVCEIVRETMFEL